MSIEGHVYDYGGKPARYRNEGFLYVIQFNPRQIKVGRTNNPNARISTHVRASRALLGKDPLVWVSGPHSEYKANERALLAWCRDKASLPGYRGEHFELAFQTVVRHAKELVA